MIMSIIIASALQESCHDRAIYIRFQMSSLAIRQQRRRARRFFPGIRRLKQLPFRSGDFVAEGADVVPDNVAAQMLINTITETIVVRASHGGLLRRAVCQREVIQTGVASMVGRIITHHR